MKLFYQLFLLVGFVLMMSLNSTAENIALNASYTLEPAPNYSHCTDADDLKQLTDGKYVEGYFWTQQGTVGWSGKSPVVITIDLGFDKPISGISFSTAAGVAGVKFPKSIMIFIAGEDGIFHKIGDLIKLNEQENKPPSEGYSTYQFKTNALQTHGKKVALIVFGEPYIFCDEIEIWKGNDEWINQPLPGKGLDNLQTYLEQSIIHEGVKHRITADIDAVRKIAESLNDLEKQKQINADLDNLLKEIDSLPIEYPTDFKTIFPLNSTHAKVFKTLAQIWREHGITQSVIWTVNPWCFLELCPAVPGASSAEPSQLYLDMMQNEVRSVTFNIASPEDTEIQIEILGLPENVKKSCLSLYKVPWTDTKQGTPVAAALLQLIDTENKYHLQICGGLQQQIWITVNSKELNPGTYNFMLKINDKTLPFTLQVYPIRFPDRPSLHTGGWDYTNEPSHYEATETNRNALVKMLQEYFVDTPWATSSAMPFGTYDSTGAMTAPPDTSNFDAWRQLWQGARRYCVFASVSNKLKEWQMETPEFNRAVGDWAKFWSDYMRQAGLEPSQLIVLLVDEPRNQEMDVIIKAWAKAIHASGAGILVWEDPIYNDMSKALPEMIAECDILCPQRSIFYRSGEAYQKFFIDQRDKGKILEFYSCSGPMRLLDPYIYCRLQAWDCWRYGAISTNFWAFADGGGGSSWNEYTHPRTSYTPLFIDENTVVPGKHLEAMREGIEDYEYLLMLDKAIKDGKGSPELRGNAQSLLRDLPKHVCDIFSDKPNIRWKDSPMLYHTEQARQTILQTLTQMQK
ncbi:MAG TPA: hypothetical protein PLX23_02485 [Candidatus Hydrogenedens sp.]|nr:hypothetical protein [Candidatus Hydrogenedens sp.]